MPEIVSRKDAKAGGLKRYYTGKICKNGHDTDRFASNGACRGCLGMWEADRPKDVKNAQRRALWVTNKERIAKLRAERYSSNPQEYRDASVSYYWRNVERCRARAAAWGIANPEKAAARAAAYYEAKADEFRARARSWYLANPEQASVGRATRRGRLRAAPGRYTADELKALILMQKSRCAYCRASLRGGYHADHIVPLAKGGSNWISNIQLTCQVCNNRKHAKDPLVFARQLGRLL